MEEAIKVMDRLGLTSSVNRDNILKIYAVLGNKAIMDLESVFRHVDQKFKTLDETIDEFSKYHPLG